MDQLLDFAVREVSTKRYGLAAKEGMRMRFWINDGVISPDEGDVMEIMPGHYLINTPEYNEYLFPARDLMPDLALYEGRPTYLSVYYIQLTDTGWMVGSWWGGLFDVLTVLLNDPRIASKAYEVLLQEWRTTALLFANGRSWMDTPVSIVGLSDPDLGGKGSFLLHHFGNVSPKGLQVKKMMKGNAFAAFQEVINLSIAVFGEVGSGIGGLPAGMTNAIGREFRKQDMKAAAKSTAKLLSTLHSAGIF